MRIATITLTLLAALALLVGPAQAGSTFENKQANADTLLYDTTYYSDDNHGSDTTMWIAGVRPTALVRYDLPDVPNYGGGVTIESATAYLYATTVDASPTTINAYMQTQEWVESQATWNNAKTGTAWGGAAGGWGTGMSSGTNILSTNSYTTTGWKGWDITTAAQAWMDGTANNGILFELTAGKSKLGARENSNAGLRPRMEITWRANPTAVVNYSQKDVAYLSSSDGVTEAHWGGAPREHVGQASFGDLVTWLKFDIPDLAGHVLKEATLDFGPSDSPHIPQVTATSHSDDSWSTLEYSVTPDGVDVILFDVGADLSERLSVDITDMLTAAGEGLGETLTIKLYRTDGAGTRYVDMNGGSGDYVPMTLSLVTEVPEPASMSLLGIGGLIALRRRRR